MSLDIRSGDFFTVGSISYTIRTCNPWTDRVGSTASMRRMCSVTASTKRKPAVVGAKRGLPAAKLSGLKCTPLDPPSTETLHREVTQAPMKLLETFVDGGDTFYHLILEDLKTNAQP